MRQVFLLIFILITGFSAGYAKSPEVLVSKETARVDAIDKFWTWFVANQARLRNFESDPSKYLNELLIQAKKIKEGLAIELEPPKDGIINMTISADGDKTLFKTVQAIVAKAPKLSGWHFYAFRQRMPEETIKGMKVNVEGVELDASKMMFFPMQSGDTLDIIIYVKGITEDNFNDIAYAGLMLLDNVLGEYDCVTKVRSYDFHDMPVKEDELAGLRPLLELPKFVDGFHAGKKKK